MKKTIIAGFILSILFLCSCGNQQVSIEDTTKEVSTTSTVSKEAVSVSSEASNEPVSEETDRLDVFENYWALIHAIEEAMYNPGLIEENPEMYYEYDGAERNYICSAEFFGHLYDGSDDIAYQNLGFLIEDIDGDGVDELLLGENDPHPEKEYDGIIYDLYTYEDGYIKHLFSGWPRNAYHLTDGNEFVCEWATSADEFGKKYYKYSEGELIELDEPAPEQTYVYPEFTPMGPKWRAVGDVAGDARSDYLVFKGIDGVYSNLSLYIAGEGIVFEHEDALVLYDDYGSEDVGFVEAHDLDGDGEKEIVLNILPNVNSASLMKFAVIKKKGDKWVELEGFNDQPDGGYSFPLVMKHDKDYKVILSCEGCDKTITFDIEEKYKQVVEEAGEVRHEDSFWDTRDYYENEILAASEGTSVGNISPWGVWDIRVDEYIGNPCLVATQGVEGYGKFDLWGVVYIYFDYDSSGNMRVLDLKFVDSEM
ncbi:hypothetical protein SAMN02910339_01639 [Lachnospiraceae bacterium YSD2013]|nr:hypothetical protein SAMN02910339_01639 [Lachnospiraceae bacterium YSD2013]